MNGQPSAAERTQHAEAERIKVDELVDAAQ